MNSSLSWNDVVNPVFWLATRAKRMILPSRTCQVTMAIDTDMGYWPRHFFFFFFFSTCKIDRNERKKRNLANNHIHLTLPQYPYIPGTSYVAKLRVLSGRGNGRDRARQTTPSVEQAIGIQYLSPSEVDNVLGKSVQLHQNPFTNHHLPGFFAYPARHRRE